MSSPPIGRRASYGPTSPVVGRRGAATRACTIDKALQLFGERGFHGTTIEDIASAVGISRAAFYQYFASKHQVFIELVEESGRALHKVYERLDGLGPTAEGFAALRNWIEEWSDVFDQYTTMFVEWANVNSPGTPLRAALTGYVDHHAKMVAAAFGRCGVAGDLEAFGLVFMAVLDRYHYLRVVHPTPFDRPASNDHLALAYQLSLFPDTPASVLDPYPGVGTPSTAAAPAVADRVDRFDELGPQARRTVERLLDAGATVFADAGLQSSSIDAIVTEAGVARGTLYKYFADRTDLFGTLAQYCGHEMSALAAGLAGLDIDADDELETWLRRFHDLYRRYAGVLHLWTQEVDLGGDTRVGDACEAVVRQVQFGFGRLHEARPERPVVDRRAGALMLVALLERSPDMGFDTRTQPDLRRLLAAQARFIRSGLLG